MSFWQLFYSVGAFIAYWVAYACSKHKASLGMWDWKMVVIFQMLVPTIIITQLPFLPETPRVSFENPVHHQRNCYFLHEHPLIVVLVVRPTRQPH